MESRPYVLSTCVSVKQEKENRANYWEGRAEGGGVGSKQPDPVLRPD